jgi:preprotein translocase subunit YajC
MTLLNDSFVLASINFLQGIDVKNIFLLVSFIGVFYFFMIRPQQKRQKEQRDFIDQLKKGVEVITIGGIHGKVYEVHDQLVVIEVDNKGTKITFSKNAVSIEATKKQTQKS